MTQYLILILLITCNSLLTWGQNKIVDSKGKYEDTIILELYFGKDLNQIEIIKDAGGVGPSCFGICNDKIYILDAVKKRILIYQNKKLINTIDNIDIYDFVLDKNEKLYGLSVYSGHVDPLYRAMLTPVRATRRAICLILSEPHHFFYKINSFFSLILLLILFYKNS